ncbi:MAG: IS110 family transposase [Candidatus Edwardsbacteria bacterium]
MSYSNKMSAKPEHLCNYIKNNFPDKKVLCVYEAGPTGYHLYDYMKKKNQPCLMVSPLSVPKAPNQKVKTNRIDSIKLAQELKSGNIKPIRVPEGYYRDLRYLVESQENYTRMQRVAKQRIKALLLHANLNTKLKDADKHWSNRCIKQIAALKCSYGVKTRLDMLLVDLDFAKVQTLNILRSLRNFFKEHKTLNEHRQYLQTIPGIGFKTASSILGRIGDPANLNNPRELGSYIGLVPKENSTGDSINKGSITHMGNGILRSLLIESSWVAIRKDKELEQFYHRIRKKNHPNIASRKAIVAVARKLTHRIYCVLKEQRNYIVH